jgi:hypothetical protein
LVVAGCSTPAQPAASVEPQIKISLPSPPRAKVKSL